MQGIVIINFWFRFTKLWRRFGGLWWRVLDLPLFYCVLLIFYLTRLAIAYSHQFYAYFTNILPILCILRECGIYLPLATSGRFTLAFARYTAFLRKRLRVVGAAVNV